jgi:hypothetical protein
MKQNKPEQSKQGAYEKRQRSKGLVKVSNWIWSWQRRDLREYAKKLREQGDDEIDGINKTEF